jgi:hypothetical protein
MLNYSKNNLIIYYIWRFFVAIEPTEPLVGPVNQWASHLTGSLAGPVFKTMTQLRVIRVLESNWSHYAH